ncbi:MAG: LytTR family transcriptional regulator [Lachnospiraceae bacterium]|nr:LytTR family transcriptional regulator [Lachnospiraceae bacterium]
MHLSNEWNELVEEEIFLVQISTLTYHYVKKLLAESVSKKSPVLVIKIDLCNQFVDTNTVIYIQATDRDCILHMLNEGKQFSRALKDLQEQLPPNFYRIHRNYLENRKKRDYF